MPPTKRATAPTQHTSAAAAPRRPSTPDGSPTGDLTATNTTPPEPSSPSAKTHRRGSIVTVDSTATDDLARPVSGRALVVDHTDDGDLVVIPLDQLGTATVTTEQVTA